MSIETLSSENKEAAAGGLVEQRRRLDEAVATIPGVRAGSVRNAAALAAAKVIGVRQDLVASDAEELFPPLRVPGPYTV